MHNDELDQEMLARREVIRRALVMAGASTLLSSTALLNAACASTNERTQAARGGALFSTQEIGWLDEMAETILPATETPGAKAAEVGAFIALMVTDCMSPGEQAAFKRGMQSLEDECVRQHGTGLLAATAEQRLTLLQRIDGQRYAAAQRAGAKPHYFHAMKELTVLGYFTSEIGYRQALRYAETPGRFDPCADYDGGPLWARHA